MSQGSKTDLKGVADNMRGQQRRQTEMHKSRPSSTSSRVTNKSDSKSALTNRRDSKSAFNSVK